MIAVLDDWKGMAKGNKPGMNLCPVCSLPTCGVCRETPACERFYVKAWYEMVTRMPLPEKTTCGWLICGDPTRPCARRLGHNFYHQDLPTLEHAREAARERSRKIRAADPEGYLARFHAYRASHPEKVREWKRRDRQAHVESVLIRCRRARARKRNVPHVDWTREQVIALYGERCYLCGGPYEHTDHVIPISRYGWDRIENLRPACQLCNLSKHDNMPPVILQAKIWFELGVHRAGLVCE
jgi:5-methylcytosine-specific restriction endonuclease McrA